MIEEELKYDLTDTYATFAKSHHDDGGFDLSSIDNVELNPQDSKLIDSGVRVAIPEGSVGLLLGRSSLASKRGVTVIPGVIDAGYRGNIKMNCHNLDVYFRRSIHRGDRIAQLLILKLTDVKTIEAKDLGDTVRGSGGFGSTSGN